MEVVDPTGLDLHQSGGLRLDRVQPESLQFVDVLADLLSLDMLKRKRFLENAVLGFIDYLSLPETLLVD